MTLVAAENEAGLNATEECYSLSTPDAERCLKPSDLRKVPSCPRCDGGPLCPPGVKEAEGEGLFFIVFLVIEESRIDCACWKLLHGSPHFADDLGSLC